MIARLPNRSGISRVRLVVTVAGGLLGLALLAFVLQVWGFYRIMQYGDAGLLASLQFTDRLTVSATAPAANAATVQEIGTVDDPKLGSGKAPIQVIEFADFGCPFSKEENGILREFMTRHPDVIDLQFRDFPLTDLHSGADRASMAATCANAQGKFWAMHDKLFTAQGSFSAADLTRDAAEIGLDAKQFASCMADPATAQEQADDSAAGATAGVRGTPTFFINGYKVEGALPAEAWEQIAALAEKR